MSLNINIYCNSITETGSTSTAEERVKTRGNFVIVKILTDLPSNSTEWKFYKSTSNTPEFTVTTNNSGVVGFNSVGNILFANTKEMHLSLDRTEDWYVQIRFNKNSWSDKKLIDLTPRSALGTLKTAPVVTKTSKGATVNQTNPRFTERRTSRGIVITNKVYIDEPKSNKPSIVMKADGSEIITSVNISREEITEEVLSQNAPDQVSQPTPLNGDVDQLLNVTLSWAAALRATTYNVYFGTTPTPELVSSGQIGLSYAPGPLISSRVQSEGSVTIANGVVTRINGDPWDANAADMDLLVSGAAYSIDLRNSDTQLTLDNLTIQSTNANFVLVKNYYWRVDSVNSSGITTGMIYKFRTGAAGLFSVLRAAPNKLMWVFDGAIVSLHNDPCTVLEFQKNGTWYTPIGIELDGDIIATYAVDPLVGGGENYRVLTPLPLVEFDSGSAFAAPIYGVTDNAE